LCTIQGPFAAHCPQVTTPDQVCRRSFAAGKQETSFSNPCVFGVVASKEADIGEQTCNM